MSEVKLIHVEGKTYIDVKASVAQAKKQLQTNNEITLIARQTEIGRIGMIIKNVEQQCNCRVTRLQNENKIESVQDKDKDGKVEKKEVSVLYLRATLTKN